MLSNCCRVIGRAHTVSTDSFTTLSDVTESNEVAYWLNPPYVDLCESLFSSPKKNKELLYFYMNIYLTNINLYLLGLFDHLHKN